MHIPVLKNEILECLDPKSNENFIDCTLGEAGHAKAILEKIKPDGKVLGIEIDKELCKKIEQRISEFDNRLVTVNDSYVNLKEIVEKENLKDISGILMDLGMSSWHIDESNRGFSFSKEEPLDMRYRFLEPLTAEKIVNEYSEEEVENILKEYGEERFAKRISRKIKERREEKKIKTTAELIDIIKSAIPYKYQRGKINPATRVFQALRIGVNDELNNLRKALPVALEVLRPGGRLAVVSFHSLEDRIVKNFFKDLEKQNKVKILTKKPITAKKEEIIVNNRARSAKLRAIKKI
jgi:16S rRNA (cytosine1402-N4)-methyltransferase